MLELADHFGVFWFILMRSGYSLRNAMMAVIKFWMLSPGGVVLPDVVSIQTIQTMQTLCLAIHVAHATPEISYIVCMAGRKEWHFEQQ